MKSRDSQIQAELLVAKKQGCDAVDDVVSRIETVPSRTSDKPPSDVTLKLTTDTGSTFHCRKVLLATGAFTELRKLLPDDVTADVDLVTQSVVYAQLSDADLAAYK